MNPTVSASAELAETIGQLALSKKAENILILDVRKTTAITDFFVICSADTDIQVKAIADAVRRGTTHKPWHVEGYERLTWVLVDYVDVVLHVFQTATRDFYQLERLWADVPIREITDDPETVFNQPAE
ncbi:MAG: ribosome silencing factor [Candidatus Neomarinimicrobiota bacterium]